MNHRAIRAGWIGALLLMAALARAQAPSVPATRPSDIVVREWLVLLSDPYQSGANTTSQFSDTLPDFVQTRRPRARGTSRNQPMPVGVIRISAPPRTKLDVQLDARGGTVLSTWPITRARGTAVMWRDVTVAPQQANTVTLDDQHWLGPLRQTDRPYLGTADRAEKFLLYDVTLPFLSQLSLAPGASPETVKLAHAGYTPLHELTFYRPEPDQQWSSAHLASLDPPAGATPPRTITPAQTAAAAAAQRARAQQEAQIQQQIARYEANLQAILQAQALGQIGAADVQQMLQSYQAQVDRLRAQLPPRPPEPIINPAAVAERPGASEVPLVRAQGAGLEQLLSEWEPRLAKFDLDPADLRLMLSIVKSQIEATGRLSAVYRMDDAELERLLPLEVIPTRADVRRVAMVIVTNIDPVLPAQIDGLISQLGDPQWKTREAATQQLIAIGNAARSKLQSALTNRDAEIAMRAERLLAIIGNASATAAGPVNPVNSPTLRIR